jgi:glutaminyl-peptide cyclotransferase
MDRFRKNYQLEITNPQKEWNDDDTVKISIVDDAGIGVDSVLWRQNGRKIDDVDGITLSRKLTNQPLGTLTYEATIFQDGRIARTSTTINRKNPTVPTIYKHEVVNTYPHSDAYTQGLEFYDGKLYESAGQYQESDVRITQVETGEILKKQELPETVFAEGLTVMDDKVYQLTWKSGFAYIYDTDLNRTGEFKYNRSKQGWGLCNDGEYLYKSDGTDKIWKIDPNTYEELEYIQIVSNKKSYKNINELEWVNGKIYANVYQENLIFIVNPKNGALEAAIDLTTLKDQVDNWDKEDNVLNGIAYDPQTDRLFVTGKRWDKMFEISIKK